MKAIAKPFFGNACAICGSAITVHQQVRSGVCHEAKCRHEALLDELRRRKAAARAALEILVAEHHQTTVAKMGLGRISVAMVPASERRVVKLPRKRRRQFQIALAKLIQQTFLARSAEGETAPSPEEQPSASEFMPERNEFQAGCAVCRGHCCRLGAPLAFLDADTMQRVRTLHPQLNARQTLRWYLSKIPRQSVEYSCVYHGDRGCTLTRSMRASICNTYHCEGLKAVGAKLDQHPGEPILLVATTEQRVVRSALYNPLDKK